MEANYLIFTFKGSESILLFDKKKENIIVPLIKTKITNG